MTGSVANWFGRTWMPTAENLPSDSVEAFNFPSKSEKSTAPSQSNSFAKPAKCPMAGIVIMAVASSFPSLLNNCRVNTSSESARFATAIPVSTPGSL